MPPGPETNGEGTSLKGIRLRRATVADSERLFRWRNHEAVRQHSGNPAPIPWDTHIVWLAQTLADPTRVLLIGERHSGRTANLESLEAAPEPVGVLRYDLSGAETEACVSIYLVPERMGQGLGAPLLRAGSAWLKETYPSLNGIRAAIRSENIASLRTFERAGYQRNKAEAPPADFQEYVYLF
jgi:RimJ/RimL family protein N-acetyltransferase